MFIELESVVVCNSVSSNGIKIDVSKIKDYSQGN